MQLVINRVFKSAGGKTAVSIDGDSFAMIRGGAPKMKESHWEKQEDGSTLREFQFDNAQLTTVSSLEEGRWKTTCFVDDEIVESAKRQVTMRINLADFK